MYLIHIMIDFKNGSVFKLSPCDPGEIGSTVAPLMIQNERIISAFKTVRDFVVFTDKRIIAVNIQGITGRKRDFSSLPYGKIQAWSVETAGSFDRDAELELWFSGLGSVRLEFKGDSDIIRLSQTIAVYVL
ncbi:PH domain-containing protein [Actinocorallia libanotica]|uniref:PH domain-containing protein n=2 Tax=Actinocorallia libanotica TaxID=46162 RepID=A0ABN1R824_9ACTN